MVDAVPAQLSGWESFYVIVGSSAGALIGLQFVVMALIAQLNRRTDHEPIHAYATPNVVHFGAVLLTAATMSAPWPTIGGASVLLRVLGFAGVCYGGITLRRVFRQQGYTPVWEDWVWHNILPFIAYAALLVGPFELALHPTGALFTVAGAALLLLFIGIHNAWDTSVYLIVEEQKRARDGSDASTGTPPLTPMNDESAARSPAGQLRS